MGMFDFSDFQFYVGSFVLYFHFVAHAFSFPKLICSLLRKFSALLVHPSAEIRFGAIATVNASCMALGSLDSEVYVAHLLHPYLRFQPSLRHLQSPDGMETCLYPAWSQEKFSQELDNIVNSNKQLPVGPWTSVGISSLMSGKERSAPSN